MGSGAGALNGRTGEAAAAERLVAALFVPLFVVEFVFRPDPRNRLARGVLTAALLLGLACPLLPGISLAGHAACDRHRPCARRDRRDKRKARI